MIRGLSYNIWTNSVSKSRQSSLSGSPNCFHSCSNTDPDPQELLVIASLTVSVRDILRFILTKSHEGLPLAMITMDKRFAEIRFFFREGSGTGFGSYHGVVGGSFSFGSLRRASLPLLLDLPLLSCSYHNCGMTGRLALRAIV